LFPVCDPIWKLGTSFALFQPQAEGQSEEYSKVIGVTTVATENHAEPGAASLQPMNPTATGAQPSEQKLQQVANVVSDLSARVDELEQRAGNTETAESIPPSCGPTVLQDVLPEIKRLSEKVGGMDQLSKIVDSLKQPK
jgi:hypothetical protein